jgi:hypothetical protein
VSFLFPSLLWIGVPLVAVPILIHLINLRRQQRVRWAAMQFLLVSQKQNRRWILFKQLLLLAARMAAVAVLVLMLAHLMVRNEWLRLLGTGTTHHILLIDDSYSTSDRWENTSAFEEAKRAVQSIVDQAYRQSDTQLITLLRFSEAARLSAGAQPEVFAQRIDDNFRSKLPTMLAGWEPSQTDVGPTEALKSVPRLPLAGDQQSHILYLISDFRTRQFGSATEIRKLLEDMGQQINQIHLVRTVQKTHANLAITALSPESGVKAAGVETWMNVTVANYGDAPARGVVVQFQQDGDALPALPMEDIPPRQEQSKKFRVQFTGVGAHWLSAAIGADAVDVDNRRFFACHLPAAQPVLIIDGSQDGRGGRQLSLALDPGGNTHTGWSPHVESPSYLTRPDDLVNQAAVCLLDVPRLQDDELAALEAYVRGGGGAAFFVGSQTNRDFYNERLYHNGEGMFPVPLTIPTQLANSRHESTSDVSVSDHQLFRVLAGRKNGFLPLLSVDYYYAIAPDWSPPRDGSTNVIARLRNDAPLVVEKKFGGGRVVAQLTRLSTGDTPLGRWTNWTVNPVFPVLANELVGYLAANRKSDSVYQVGDDLVVNVPDAQYEPTFRFAIPGPGATKTSLTIDATSDNGALTAKLPHMAASGVYDVQLQPREGAPEQRVFAVNVPIGEGDLQTVEREDLGRQLAGVAYQFHDAADMAIDQQQLAGLQLGDALLGTLIVVLLLEQILAYVASFHVRPVRGTA